jgi:hypothetical protein
MPIDPQTMETAENPGARDDSLFTSLLESAYSLQQHQDRIRSKVPAAKFREIMGEMINTLSLIRSRHLDSDTALQLVVNRTQKLVAAGGAAVALLDGENLEYKVATGLGAALLGLRIRAKSSVFFERLGKEPLTYAWEDTALKGRILARILSVPVYRRGRLAGCIQLFSRAGHFDDYGAPVCELMSAIVSHSMSNSVPQSPDSVARAFMAESDKGVHVGRAIVPPGNGQGPKSQPSPQDSFDGAKKIEVQAKRAFTYKTTDKVGPSAGLDFQNKSIESFIGQDTPSNSLPDELEEIPDVDDLIRKLQDTDTFRQGVAQFGQVSGTLLRSPVAVPSDGRVPRLRLVSSEVDENAQTEALSPEIACDSTNVLASTDHHGSSPPAEIDDIPARGIPKKEVWSLLSRMFYPLFVVGFAVLVRIKAGAQSWPLEIAIYILLVITTLELVQRFSER